ncbi:ubiquitin-like protein ATG12 [Artemia franciscana]|uniref:Ubiquitin-like protein ATG12 n=1 Tax=Artemia franciscana TaxID=6661 RepID=A0AA88I386_ARTSF|nr:hypothetical protein QYM36_008906 [Artemia franciscana]KAK2714502.1 hypothetical protein QYM36_008906 [Artemia franciscana]KAK2714503.1 hypothetical protein QYM36_008906 [Artemia franciscana]
MEENQVQNGAKISSSVTEEERIPAEEDKSKRKVEILLKSVGDTPLVKKKKWMVEPDRTIGSIITFVKKLVFQDQNESLYIYVNQFFAPAPDQIISNLLNCFGADGRLVLHYSRKPAWG